MSVEKKIKKEISKIQTENNEHRLHTSRNISKKGAKIYNKSVEKTKFKAVSKLQNGNSEIFNRVNYTNKQEIVNKAYVEQITTIEERNK